MRRLLSLSLFLVVCCTSTGCSLDRTWFQMNSNSPMPFFGFDLRMPRKTSQVEPVTHEQQLASDWDNESVVQPVENQTSSRSQATFLNLPKISALVGKHQEEELSFTGPKAPFAP